MVTKGSVHAPCAEQGARTAQHDDSTLYDVVIVGSGAAGIGAAVWLHENTRAAVRYVVLEGGADIGGRCRTSDLGSRNELQVDVGGSWIHDYVYDNALAQRAAALRHPVFAEEHLPRTNYYFDMVRGQRVPQQLVEEARAVAEDVLRADAATAAAATDASCRSMWDAMRARLEDHFARHRDDDVFQRAVWFFINRKEAFENTEIELLAANHGSYYQRAIGPNGVPFRGYGTLLQRIAEPVRAHVRVQHEVESIEWEAESASDARVVVAVRGTRTDGARAEAFCVRARAVIVTVSVGVLKSGAIHFAPPLPLAKRLAIAHIGYGVMNKVIMEFSDRFWPEDAHALNFFSPRRGHFPLFVSFTLSNGERHRPVLVAFVTGQHARELEQKCTDEQILDAALAQLCAAYGSAPRDKLKRYVITRWGQDPHFRGSYSYISAETTREDVKNLQAPLWDGRLRFAGEACYPEFIGVVHGAFVTGQREAAAAVSFSAAHQPRL